MVKLKMYNKFFPIVTFVILVLSGCQSSNVPSSSLREINLPEPMAEKILEPAKKGKGVTDELDDEVDVINQSTSSGETKAPELPEWETIRKSASNVKNYGREARGLFNIIAELARRLEKNEEEIAKAGGQIDKMAKENAKLREKIHKMEKSATRTLLLAGITISVIGLGIGISLFFVPGLNNAALPVIAVSLIIGAVSRVLVNHPWILTIIGFGALGLVVWSIFTQATVIKELINFGEDEDHEDTKNPKSKVTKKAVNDVKKRMEKDDAKKRMKNT